MLKSKEDPFGGSSLAGAVLFKVGLGRGVILGRCHQEEGRGQPKPLAQTLTWPDPATASLSGQVLSGQAHCAQPFSEPGHWVPLP